MSLLYKSLTYHSGGHDFCEKNYEYTPAITEFWNAITSLLMVIAGASTLIQSMRIQNKFAQYIVRSDNKRRSWSIFFTVFDTISLGLLIVGFGSVHFHGTLSRFGQIVDEWNMVLSALGFNLCLRLALTDSH